MKMRLTAGNDWRQLTSRLALLALIGCGATLVIADQPAATHSATELTTEFGGLTVAPVGHFDAGGCAAGKCDVACDDGCDSARCGDGCPALGLCAGMSSCEHGDPWQLCGEHGPYSVGGWIQLGYFNKANSLFNQRADQVQLQQAWLYAERSIDTSCGFDLGGRIDYLYGTDAQDTQAFGTAPIGWDNPWDNPGPGPNDGYGNAIPQLYLEAGYGDLSVKLGHFYTIIGYEVVQAPDNFFYSHTYTMYNSEPFTHTGILATYECSEDITLYGGWTEGWDSGFRDNGDNFLGGVSVALTDAWTVTYATTIGRFGSASFNGDEQGYMHSIVSQWDINDQLTYISQSDYLSTEDNTGATVRDTYDYNVRLLYECNDCWATGIRGEWYQNEGVYTAPDQRANFYAVTAGLNYKPHANIIVRPEVRWDWVFNNTAVIANGSQVLNSFGANEQTTFAIDTIFLF